MTKRKRTPQRAEKENKTNQAPVSTMDAFSNPAARLGWGTMDLL